MLKLRNAVLTALLAFCLAMPFVSCSFNDGATGDVSDKVTVQSDNNQNGGNENPSGSDNGGNGHEHPSGGDNGGNENPSGGNNGGSGNENPSGGNEKPGEGTMYTVKYGDNVIVQDMPESALSAYKQKYGLVEVTDYTISGNVITLTDSGLKKVMDASAGEGGGHGGIPPVTDGPVTDVPVTDGPGDVEGTVYTVMYNGSPVTYPDGEPITFIGAQDDISYEAESLGLDASDYTIEGTYIILNEAGNAKVQQMLDSHGNI